MADAKNDEWTPPIVDEKTGVAMHGKHPLNHRLRAESLAKHGAKSDPDGLISDELIVDARERLDREKADQAATETATAKAAPEKKEA